MAAALVPMSAVVLGGGLEGRVLRQDGCELPGGDALQLDDRRLGDSVVEDPPVRVDGNKYILL